MYLQSTKETIMEYHLDIFKMPTKVDNKPSENFSIMVGILHVAFVNKIADNKWEVKVLWEHAFPYESNIFPSAKLAEAAIMKRLKI
jgi:hypothetical protein